MALLQRCMPARAWRLPPLRRSLSAARDQTELRAAASNAAWLVARHAVGAAAQSTMMPPRGGSGGARRVLDAGAGAGIVGERLVYNHGYLPSELLAADSSATALARARAKGVYANAVLVELDDDDAVARLPAALPRDPDAADADADADGSDDDDDERHPPRLFDAVVFGGAPSRRIDAEVLDHLLAVTRVGGVLVFTAPCGAFDFADREEESRARRFRESAAALLATGMWSLLERTPALPCSSGGHRRAFEGFAYRVEGAGARGPLIHCA